MTPKEAEDMVLYQVAAVAGVAAAEGVKIQHVKPHGALFNMAVRNRELAARSRARRGVRPVADPVRAARLGDSQCRPAAGLRVAAEVFADRAYEPDGSLASRRKPGAVIHDPAAVVARAVRMVKERTVVAIDGSVVAARGRHHLRARRHARLRRLAAKIRAGLEAQASP